MSESKETSLPNLIIDYGVACARDGERHYGLLEEVLQVAALIAQREAKLREALKLAQRDTADALRYRRILAATEMPFPPLSVCEDPENDACHKYGRGHIDSLIDQFDEIEPIARAALGDLSHE